MEEVDMNLDHVIWSKRNLKWSIAWTVVMKLWLSWLWQAQGQLFDQILVIKYNHNNCLNVTTSHLFVIKHFEIQSKP